MTTPWNSIYCIPRPERKKPRTKKTPKTQKLKAQIKALKTQLVKKNQEILALRTEGKENPISKAYRGHIAGLNAQIERLKDPSIPKRANSKMRVSFRSIEHASGFKINEAEKLFVSDVTEDYEVYRNGWPDFFLIHKESGTPRFVEVKSPTDKIPKDQILMFEALDRIGFPVEVFRAGKERGKEFSSWRVAAGLPENGSGNVSAWPQNNLGVDARPTSQIPTDRT